jgi:glycosyltransferase involved in cell wall biosynthesis
MVVKPFQALHLINSQQRRGAEVFAAQLVSCLQEKGRFKNLVCSLYDRGDDNLPVEGVPVFKLGGREGAFNRIGLDLRLLSRLYGLLRNFQPDVIVAHGGDTLKYTVSAGLFYGRAAAIYRNIVTASAWANSPARVKLNRLLLNRIDAVVSVSQSIKQDFLKVYRLPEDRVAFIPNGVATADFDVCAQASTRTQVRQELGLSQQDTALISVGDLSPEKGYQDLLPLLAELRSGGFENHTLLVGDGPLRQELRQQAEKLNLTGQVHFLGRRSDVPRLLAAADLFVLPSKTEGMPAVLIEAGLAGLPAVAFDVGGVAEVVEHQVTGLLARPSDFQGLAQALIALSEDPQRYATMGATSRLHCHQQFDIRQVASKYEELFLKMLNAPVGEGNG